MQAGQDAFFWLDPNIYIIQVKRGLRDIQGNQPRWASSLGDTLGDVIQQREAQGNMMQEDHFNYSCTAVDPELIVALQKNAQASCWITCWKDLLLTKQKEVTRSF